VLAQELAALAAGEIAPTDGGVAFSGPWELVYHINLESRVASRVLWQVGRAHYRDERDVHAAARELDWPRWFNVERTLRVNVAAIKSPLKSLDFATLTIKDAICDRFRAAGGRRPSVDTHTPDVRVHAFLTADEAMFYLDTSGEALFKRGWRKEAGDAPLRENLAAGILKLSGWQPGMPLYDPLCGSGTFLIEAALIALDIAPGARREFGFEKLVNFDRAAWRRCLDAAKARERKPEALPIFGSDLYGDTLKIARANLTAAGLEAAVNLKQVNVLETTAPAASGIVIANPPYGVRLEEEQALAEFYPKLGDVLKRRFAGWTTYIFTADLRLAKLIGLKPSKRTPLYNGSLECRLFELKLVAGQMRRPVGGENISE
jgi:putative N6-adenine-specific DNA methylase